MEIMMLKMLIFLVNSMVRIGIQSLLTYNSCSFLETTLRIIINLLGLKKIYEYGWKQQQWSTSFFYSFDFSLFLSGFKAEIYYQLAASGIVRGR